MVVNSLKKIRDRLEADARLRTAAELAGQREERPFSYHHPIPDDLWIKCAECSGVTFREDFEQSGAVCSHCGHHYRIDSRERLRLTVDPDSFVEWDAGVVSANPIEFAGYPEKLRQLRRQTGLGEAVITGSARIEGLACAVCIMDSRFLMGSMGAAVGEKVVRLFERALEQKLPVIVFAASGGARMQEGILSLMQMARTAAAVGRYREAGLPYLSVLTDPTTGGVTASFPSLGDVILSEPGTLIGFAGRRVIEGTIAEALPEGFQRAEFLLEHGFLDLIVPRSRMRRMLADLLRLHQPLTSTQIERLRETVAALPQREDGFSPTRRKGSDCLDLIRQKNRPVITDYLPLIFDQAIELHGDRQYADDPAIWCGIGSLAGVPVTIIGHRKGRSLDESSKSNFGMPHPEGYRKAMRLMRQAERFGRPVLTFIDTPGAYCGIGAEERGQGEAIAANLLGMMALKVPVLSVVTGEGGSGGALAIGVCDRLGMLANALYSVISPRGFASLLWKDPSREREAADTIRITAHDLQELGICDEIIAEPPEGAHVSVSQTAEALRRFFLEGLCDQLALNETAAEERSARRYARYARYGVFAEADVDGIAAAGSEA